VSVRWLTCRAVGSSVACRSRWGDAHVVKGFAMKFRRWAGQRGVVGLGVSALLVTVMTGCGNSSDTTQSSPTPSASATMSSAESWANEVCGSALTWQQSLQKTKDTLTGGGNLNAQDIHDALNSAMQATDTFVTDLGQLHPPKTAAGSQAEEILTTLSQQIKQQEDVIKAAVGDGSTSLPELLTKVSAVTGAVSTMLTDAGTAVTNLKAIDGGAEVKAAFESAPKCQSLDLSGNG
jgi:hypothetical protein